MAIELSGIQMPIKAGVVTIKVNNTHPLIQLCNVLPWQLLTDLVVSDLKKTTKKGFWFMGRRIRVRIHLAAYLLQYLYNLTDRKIEYLIKDNAAFQLFCGLETVEGWHVPDHTKIQEFRSRLSPETQRVIANAICQHAVSLGFADPSEVDFDSTVQEANIAYPSDATLMTKLICIGKKFVDFASRRLKHVVPERITIDVKSVKEKARKYFFLSKNKSMEIKRKIFRELLISVKNQIKPVVELCQNLRESHISKLPWNIKRAYYQLQDEAWRYLLDVAHFTRTHTIKWGKILSFHAKEVTCIRKGKAGKEYEFGRVFQLGRLKGNFMFALKCASINMHDKLSLVPLLQEHSNLFGQGVLENPATDKGYWSAKNRKAIIDINAHPDGLQRPIT